MDETLLFCFFGMVKLIITVVNVRHPKLCVFFFFLNNYVVSNSSNADWRIHISHEILFNVNTNKFFWDVSGVGHVPA